MPMDWEAAYKAAGVKKTSSGKSSSGGTDWAKAYRAAGVEMQKPELEDLGEMPSVSRSGWRGMYTANGGTMRGAALQRGAAELETQGKELSALELYIQRAQENARKAGDYLRYSGTEESENSYRDALEAYQRAVDAYNEGAKEYNSGLTAFRNTEEVKLPGRTEGKSYGELQKMIEDTADELDRTQDENQRGRLNRELQYYRAVQSQTTPTAKEAAEEARRAERDYKAEAGAVRQLYTVMPDGTTVPIRPGVTQQEAVENEKRSARAAELERVANAYRAIEYDMAHEEGVAEMPQGMRDVILEAGRASLTVQDAGTAARRGDGVTGSEELGEEIAGAQETVDEARRALRALGYDEDTVDSYIEWGAMKAGQERAQRVAGMYEETAEDRNALQNVLSGVGWGITSGAGYLDLLRQEVATAGSVDPLTGKKKPVDFYSDAMLPTVIRNAITEGEKTKIEKKMMEKYSDKEVAQKKAEKRMNAYQIAESMGESAITMALSVMGVPATTLILASSAASQTALSMHEQGYGEGQAMTMAGIAGLAEYITEKVSLENFTQIFGQRSVRNLTGWKQKLPVMMRNVLSQAVTEGSEEVASDIINGMADMLVLRDDGQFYRRVRAYQAQGMTQEEAAAAVMHEEVKELVDSFKAGAISGGLFGAGGTAINAALAKYQDTGTGRTITRAGNAQQVTELVQALDQEAKTRLGLGKYTESSAEQVGRAARILTEEKMADAIRGRLTELGETANDDLVAAIMDSAEPGIELNWKERQALSSSTAGQQVVNELAAVGGLGNKSAAQLAVDGLRDGTLTRDNAWVIQAIAEQEQAERNMTEAKKKTAPEEETGKRNYSRRANEIFSNAEKLGEYERIFGPLEGSNTEKRAKIAETLRKIDSETFRFEGAEEVAQEVETAAEETVAEETAAEETAEQERETPQYTAEQSYVRGLMRDMSHAGANEIQRSPALRSAWESLTGEKLSENRNEAHDQIMKWSGDTELRTAEQRQYLNTEDQIAELAVNGTLEIPGENGKMVLHLQESRKGGAVSAVTREGQRTVLFEGDNIEDAARQAVEYAKGEQNGGQSTRAGGERPVGVDTQERAEGLAGEAGSDQSGTEQGRRIEKIKALALKQSSAAAQGVKNGTDTVKNRFFRPGDSEAVDKLIREDAEYAAVAALCKARGQNLILFTGLLEVNESGKTILTDGMQQGSDIYIRADGNEHTPLKIYEHEDTHDAIEAAGGENGALYQSMKARLIRSLGGEKQFEALKAKYAEALPDGYSEYQIVQEMLSDARGTMNDFKGNTKLKAELDEEVRQQIGERRTGNRGSGSNRSYVGQLSITANTNMLTRAEQMEQQNIDAETIRQETGWFRGADGEWRYEIDDSRARVNLKGDARFRQEHQGYARYMELMDTMLYGELTSDEFKELRTLDREWSDVSKKLSASVRDGEARLGDVMENDGLYEAYPDIAEIRVSFEKMEAGNRGAYIPSQNRIVLNEELKNDPDALMNSLLHEVQHVIQQKEGFAGGASPEYWNREETYNRAMEKWQDEHGKIFWNLSAEDKALYREYREISEKEDAFLKNPTLEALEEMDALEERSDELYRELYGKEWFGKLNRLDRLMSDMEQAVKSMYWSTAGEIEARDTSSRRSMTAEERKNSPPDTGDELTVFADDSGVSLYTAYDESGKPVTVVTTGQDVFAGVGKNKYANIAQKIIKEKFRGKTLPLGENDLARITGNSAGEYGYPAKRGGITPEEYNAKMKAATELDSLLENSEYVRWARDNQNHRHKEAELGWDYYRTVFVVDGKAFEGIINIANSENGRMFYDMTDVKEIPGTYGEYVASLARSSPVSGNLYGNTIAQATKNVNTENASSIGVDADTETPVGTATVVEGGVRLGNGEIVPPPAGMSAEEFAGKLNGLAERRQTQRTAPEEQKEVTLTEALEKIGVTNITGSLADYGNVRSEQNMARAARDAKKYLRRVLKETNADEKTRVFARDMARGLYTEQDIPASMSRDKVKAIADAYRYVDGVTTDSLSYRRRQINFKLDEDARKLFKDSEQYDPGKFGQISKILMNERTPDRVLRSIFGEKKGAELYEYYWRPIIENNAAAKLWKNRQREDVREFRDSKGKVRELNQDEKAYAMKVLEGLAFEEEYSKAAGMDKENLDRYITNFRNLMEMMPEPGYNAEAERVDRVLDGTLSRAEAEKQSGNVGLFRRIYENRMATASLPQLDEATQKTLDGYEAAMQNRSEIEADETVDAAIIEAAAKAYQQKYADMYTAINQVLVAHGYEEIGFIKGYAPHMQPEAATNGLGKIMQAMGMQSSVGNLPASIAGMTANFKPNMRYNPHFQTRTGKETEYDIAKGFQEYTDYMGDILYHMDDIMRLRRAVNYFRTEYAGEGIRERIEQAKAMLTAKTEDKAKFAEEHDLGYVPGMSDGQIAELIERYIEDNYGEAGKLTKYSEFTTWLENAANILAGKQSLADRGMEYTGGRRVLNIGNNVLRVFRNSKVAGNLSSVLNQVAQLPAITTHFLKDGGGKYMAQALADMASGELEADGWRERSAFLVGKMDEVKISEKDYEKFMNYIFTPAGMMDNAISTMAVRAEYLRQLDKGKSDKEAMRLADDYGRQVMGSRVKLEKPQAYESKRILSQMVHMFQVEAANSFDYIVSDLPLEIRSMAQTQGVKKAAGATAAAIVMYLLQAFLLNRVAEETYGGSPVPFDLLGMTAQFFASGNGLRAGDYMLQVIDNGLEDMGGERIFGTENTIGTEDFDLKAAAQDVLYTMGGDVPLVRNALATLGAGDQTLPIPSVEKIWTGAQGIYKGLAGTDEKLGGGDADWRKVAESAANIVGEVAPVGSQIKKSVQGILTMQYGGAYAGVGDNAQLKYAVDPTAGNWLKAVLFGRNALGQNEAYYAAEEKNLTAAQTDVWEMLVEDMGMEREAAYKELQRYRATDRDKSLTTAEKKRKKLELIDGLDIPESGKVEVWVDLMADGDHTKDEYWAMETMMKMGATFADIAAAKSKHDEIAESEGKKSAMATEFAAWVDQYAKRRGLSDTLAEKMKSTWKFWSMTPTEATTYEKLVDSNLSSSKATHIYTLWSLLQPTGGRSTVSDVQKLYTLAVEGNLTDEERYAAAGTLTDMEEYNESGELSAYGKMLQVQRQGMSFKDYADLRRDGALDYYIKYRSTVDDTEAAKKIALEVMSLGTDDVKDWERVQAICKATGDEDYQVAAMEAIMDETEYFRFIQANGYGVTPEMWVKLKRALPKFDADYSGTYKQAEVKSAIDSLNGLDEMERAALWQMTTMGKKNPYNREVGTEMYVSYNRWSGERKAAEQARRKQEMEG